MAARGVSEAFVAKALNSARDANITDQKDSEELESVIREYFTSPEFDDTGDLSEDEEKSDDEVSGGVESDCDGVGLEHEEETSDTDSDDQPLIEEFGVNNERFNDIVHPDEEMVKVKDFDCKCKVKTSSVVSRKRGCIAQFSDEEVLARRLDMKEYSEAEKDMFLMGVLSGIPINYSDQTVGKPYRQKERTRNRSTYLIDSKIVCRETFKFIYGISQNKLTNVQKRYRAWRDTGVLPGKKWGGRRFNTNALHPDDVDRVVTFLGNFAEDHALVLPGRVPGFKRSDVKILPSSQTKASIWRHYRQLAVARGQRAVGKTSFFKLWEQYVPFIVVGRPMTDLCWQCKQNNESIRRTTNLVEEERLRVLGVQMDHLRIVEDERKFYKDMVEKSKTAAATAGITALGPHASNTLDARIHYSFDYAQQVHLPSSPLQPGPIYFLVPRKCGIFGVCAEGIPQQMNYLIDEGMTSGKGSNMVISLLHHFFENYGFGERYMDLHCDNCSGQNKNRFVLWYLAWRAMRGLHTEISVNFMPAGHTKFSPDWCFGLLKRRFRISEVHCLSDFVHVINTSTLKGSNRAQLVGTESGEVRVPVYDWQTFFNGWFRPLKGIKTNQHFRFEAGSPGIVFFRQKLSDAEQRFNLAVDLHAVQRQLVGLPPVIPPPGLSAERRQYLRQHIRPFVRPGVQDIVCP